MTGTKTSYCRAVSLVAVGIALMSPLAVSAQDGAGGQGASVPLTDEETDESSEALDGAIIVTGFRSSLAQALEEKRSQAVAVDTILAEDIGKFPDSNLAESMQRLPGVSLSRSDGGEGRTITVRGLGAQFTRVRINGMEAVSQSGASDANGGTNGGRSFAFNVFPSEIFNSLSVRKTASADVEEGSLGATVDLAAPRPLSFTDDFTMSASARALYNDISRKVDPKVSALVSKQFADGTFGVLGAIAYNRRRTRDVGYSAVLVLPAWVNGGFCSPIGVTPQTPETDPDKGTDALNCSAGNPRTGTIEAWDEVQGLRGPSDRPGGGAFFPRLPRYLDSQQDASRLGGTLTFQWSPDEDTNISLDGLYSRYSGTRADSYISGLSFARSASNNGQPMTSIKDIEIDDNGSVVYGLYDGVDVRSERWVSEFSTTFKQLTLDMEHRFSDNFKLSGLVGYGISDFKQPSRGWFNIDANDTRDFSVDFRDNRTYPTIGFGSTNVADPSAFAYGPGLADGTVNGTWSESKSRSKTITKAAELNAEWDINDAFGLKVGGQYREADYHNTGRSLDPARRGTQQISSPLSELTLTIDDVDDLLGYGAPSSWVAADRDKFFEEIGIDDSWFCGVECGRGDSGVTEKVTSAYGMVTFNLDSLPLPVRGNAGVRYVHTDQFSFGYVPVANPEGSYYPTRGELAEVSRSYDDWLPSANLVAELNPDLQLRLAAAKVMSRPDLSPLIPNSGVDAVGRRGSIANPFLEPIRATTYDAALEWYFAPGSLLSVAYFRKDISTYIQRISSLIPFNELGLPESLLGNSNTLPTELFTINQLANTPGGKLDGFELNFQAQLRFLPGFLGNMGVLASGTLVNSKIDYILQSEDGVPTLTTTADLIGLSGQAASGTLYYEDDRFSARVTGNYRSRYINTIPSGAQDSDYIANKPMFNVDFQMSYQINDRFKVLLEGQNITNQDSVQYIDSTRQDSLFALRSGRTFTIGVDFRL